jgi:hypothetical protein
VTAPALATDREAEVRRRLTQVRELLVPTCRSTAWRPLHLAGSIAVAIAATAHRLPEPAPADLVASLRFAAVALAVGAGAALDDPTRPHLDGAPVTLAVRQSLRLVVVLGTTLCWWVATIGMVATHPAARAAAVDGRSLPVLALTVELVALLLIVWAVAALVVRRRGGSGAVAGGGMAVATPVVLLFVPERWGFLAGDPGAIGREAWTSAHLRWLGVALLAVTVLAVALRDPARGHTARSGRTPR